MFAQTPEPPYYAVIFTSLRTENDPAGYAETGDEMMRLAAEQDGYLGCESVRNGLGITVSYWRDEASIRRWKQQADHMQAQKQGRESWYAAYALRICKVERAHTFEKGKA